MGAGPLTAGQVRRRSPFECVAASALLPASPAGPLPPLSANARSNVGSRPGACTRPAASSAAAAATPARPAWPPPFRDPQVACLAAYITALFLWAWAELLNWRLKRSKCVAGNGAAF